MLRRIRVLIAPVMLLVAGFVLDAYLGTPNAIVAVFIGVAAGIWATLALEAVDDAEFEQLRNEWRKRR